MTIDRENAFTGKGITHIPSFTTHTLFIFLVIK